MEKNIGFITFEKFHGREDIGSSRIRARWLCNHWPEAEVARIGQNYSVIVFQKAYWLEYAQLFKGLKILDMCDADFKHWGYRIKEMIEECQAVVTSTVPLAEYMRKLTDKPVVYIPDRIDLNSLGSRQKSHVGQGDTKIVAWYGYAENYPMLDASIGALAQLRIGNLIVISSRRSPYMLPPSMEGKINLINYPWTEATAMDDLMRADVVINPQISTGRWKYKSNNKTILAWALGIPVAHTKDELAQLMTEEQRIAEAKLRFAEVKNKYDIRQSVAEYKQLIEELYAKRNS